MISEAARSGADPRRALYARFVLEHRLTAQDPLAPYQGDWEREAEEILLSGRETSPDEIARLLG
jgi:hypothetical protein